MLVDGGERGASRELYRDGADGNEGVLPVADFELARWHIDVA